MSIKWWVVKLMEYYPAVKRNRLLMYETTWMNLKEILLTEKKNAILKGYVLLNSIYVTIMK